MSNTLPAALNSQKELDIDVLCVGIACHDIVFDVAHHPGPDEKMKASTLLNCGGGLASNGAVTAARLGAKTAFVGYLGSDIYGDLHLAEFHADGVNTDWVVRGDAPTSLSAIIVKPDGARTIVNHRGESEGACTGLFDLTKLHAKSILIDGHQFEFTKELVDYAKANTIPVVLDADSLNPQSEYLVRVVDYVVASERFAHEYGDGVTAESGLKKLAAVAPNVVVTLGERGVIWQRGKTNGQLDAFFVEAVDTTGAGDAFHGAFAAGLAWQMEWVDLLRYASAVGALCCTRHGGRVGIPTADDVKKFLNH
ncbi:MAG: PfkB family carbohydrate kinase [Chloroflexota bacterium]